MTARERDPRASQAARAPKAATVVQAANMGEGPTAAGAAAWVRASAGQERASRAPFGAFCPGHGFRLSPIAAASLHTGTTIAVILRALTAGNARERRVSTQ